MRDDDDDDLDDIRAEMEAERRRKNRGWGRDERTGAWDYCPQDPQRQVDEPENEGEANE